MKKKTRTLEKWQSVNTETENILVAGSKTCPTYDVFMYEYLFVHM